MQKELVTLTPFGSLSPSHLYKILQLRSQVFVVEQHCVFQDMDDKDQVCVHLCAWSTSDHSELLAYCRLLPPDVAYKGFASIGRIVSSKTARGTGIAKNMIHTAIANLYETYGNVHIRIGAQSYLEGWYGQFGFKQSGPAYVEDGIHHLEMTLYYPTT